MNKAITKILYSPRNGTKQASDNTGLLLQCLFEHRYNLHENVRYIQVMKNIIIRGELQ